MFIHILLGIKKDYPEEEYLRILGFNEKGQSYIKKKEIKENYKGTKCYNLELKGASMYDMLSNGDNYHIEIKNQPSKKGTKEKDLQTK